ncbi:MAG: Plug domain-containing protein [Armatimonadetes bacterium]|nr:Plug domain-containing protein [Armatimonadota bacterium]
MLSAISALVLSTPLIVRTENTVPIAVVSLETIQENRSVEGVARLLDVTYKAEFIPQAVPDAGTVNLRGFRNLNFRYNDSPGKFEMRPVLDSSLLEQIEVLRGTQALSTYGGSASGAVLNLAIRDTYSAVPRGTNMFKPISVDPLQFAQQGGWNRQEYSFNKEKLSLDYKISASYSYGGKSYQDYVDKGSIGLGQIWMPVGEPTMSSFVPDGKPNKDLQHGLGGIWVQPQNTELGFQAFFPPLTLGQITSGKTPQGYVTDVEKANGEMVVKSMQKLGYSFPQMIAALQTLAPEGTDMNRLNFPSLDGDPCDYDLDCPPGTIWYPSNPAYQAMMTGVRYSRLTFAEVFAGIGRGGQDPRAMRVLCMNMEKKEPAAGVKYYPYRPKDPVISSLANLMDQANFRGPWDQARLWIYTDKATYEQVNERLVNGVGQSAYLMALADVAFAGGLDDKMLKDPKYVKPEFMIGSGAPSYARTWLMETLDAFHPKKAGEWLKGNAATMLQLVGPKADQDDNQHLADTLRRMTSFSAPEDREAALRFMSAAKAQIGMLKGKLGSGSDSLYSGRESEVALALALVKEGFLTQANDALAYVAEKGPGDSNKALAKQLLAGG